MQSARWHREGEVGGTPPPRCQACRLQKFMQGQASSLERRGTVLCYIRWLAPKQPHSCLGLTEGTASSRLRFLLFSSLTR